MQRPFVLIALIFSTSAVAATPCVEIEENNKRLECYDAQFKRPQMGGSAQGATGTSTPAAKSESSSKPSGVFGEAAIPEWLTLSESLNPPGNNRGALFSTTHQNGKTTYLVKAALRANFGNRFLPQELQIAGWSWGLGAQVAKNNSANKPVDGKRFALDASGTLFGSSPIIVNSLIGFDVVDDRVDSTRNFGARFDGTVILREKILEQGLPFSSETSGYFVYPLFGLYANRQTRAPEGEKKESFAGGYVGIDASYFPGKSLWPLRFFARSVKANDLWGSGDNARRHATYHNFGVEYAFLDPRAERGRVIPSLAVERILGSNYLEGLAKSTQTLVTFTLKVEAP